MALIDGVPKEQEHCGGRREERGLLRIALLTTVPLVSGARVWAGLETQNLVPTVVALERDAQSKIPLTRVFIQNLD